MSNPARIEHLTNLLAQAWYRVPKDNIGKLLTSLDPRFLADPIGYDDQRFETALQEFIAKHEKLDKQRQRLLDGK